MRLRSKRLRWLVPVAVLVAGGALIGASPPVEASTTHQIMYHADGNVAGEAWWNPGNHMGHSHGDHGDAINAFTIADKFCGDGWSIGVEWTIDGQRHERRLDGDCEPEEITFETGHGTDIMREFVWRIFMWDTNGMSPTEYAPEFRTDYMGSYQSCAGWHVNYSSVYPDHDGDTGLFTASIWPSPLLRASPPSVADEVWDQVQDCTPLPDWLSDDERESLYKQFYCHVLYARIPELGGTTWDVESHRDNIPWWRVVLADHKCGW